MNRKGNTPFNKANSLSIPRHFQHQLIPIKCLVSCKVDQTKSITSTDHDNYTKISEAVVMKRYSWNFSTAKLSSPG